MKEVDELILPDDVRYAPDHEWARQEGDTFRVGISDYAQDQLGDVVFVELPEIGATFAKGKEFGTVESVKAVSALYMPVGGEVIEINSELAALPGLVNSAPYTEGWMIRIKSDTPNDFNQLMDRKTYYNTLKTKHP